jgi:seryl-tRNA synthetase
MLDLRLLQKQPELVAAALAARHSSLSVEEFLALDGRRRAALSEVEALKNRRNVESAEVARLKKNGGDISGLVSRLGGLSDRIQALDAEAEAVKKEVLNWMLGVPNLPDSSVPVGKDETENEELRRWGSPPSFSFPPREHWELGASLNVLDFERAGKLTGTRFAVSRGWAARLERALFNFFLDTQTLEFGHTEIQPPVLVNRAAMQGTGQLPKFAEDLFKIENWEYFLIPTAEVPLTNLHAGEVLAESDLPLLYTAGTLCFRSEAGASGRDTRGLIRQHQFSKVEMVHFAHPRKSFEQLETMRRFAETLLERLELPYRVMVLCTGDMGFASAKTYDLEVWLPGQNAYREISSCSNCTDFQARRAHIRFRPQGGGKPEFLHTLNGSGLPTGRSLVAVMENYQTEDGGIRIPEALRPYMGGIREIRPESDG